MSPKLWVPLVVLLSSACSAVPNDEASVDDSLTTCTAVDRSALPLGVDISKWQADPTGSGSSAHDPDWTRAKAAGLSFAFVRAADGVYDDPYFARGWKELQAAGLLRGAYQYFEPAQDALAQADEVVKQVGALGPGDLPVVLDLEETKGLPSPTVLRPRVRAWADRVREGTGREPIFYTHWGYFEVNVMGSLVSLHAFDHDEFAADQLWIAHWNVACPRIPRPWTSWTFWQYTSRGRVDGISDRIYGSGYVDMDVFDGTMEQLRALAGM